MKGFFWMLTVVLLILGFFFPLIWGAAIVTALLAIASAPQGTRLDAKPRSAGLLGGAIDSAAVSRKIKKCPHCAEQIFTDAKVRKHYGRDVADADESKHHRGKLRRLKNGRRAGITRRVHSGSHKSM